MSQITQAIAARQTQITQLQSEIETLQRAVSIVGTLAQTAAKAKPKTKAKPQPKAKPTPKAKPAPKQKLRQWSAAEKAAICKRDEGVLGEAAEGQGVKRIDLTDWGGTTAAVASLGSGMHRG